MLNFDWICYKSFSLFSNKVLRLILVILLILIFPIKNVNADKTGVIKIPIHNWSSQLVGARIVGELFKKVGENVLYVPTDSQSVYQLMAKGDIDIVHSIWESAFGDSYEKALATGNIEEILTHDAVTREGWWYPIYVEKICPGMPDWKALAKCSDKFKRPDSNGKGVFIGSPIEWLKYESKTVDALGMNFIVRNKKSAGYIWKELDKAVEENKPIVIFNWSPNFVGAKYEGKFVEFPKHHPKCTTDPSWGFNPNALYDCRSSADGSSLKLAVNIDFKKNHPKAYKLVKKINFSNLDIDKMANYVDTDGLKVKEAAQKWLDEHKFKWSKWVIN